MNEVRVGRAFTASGRVQGVGYRWFVRDSAGDHGICGWVRNVSDGTVEGEAHGDAAAVEAFLGAVRKGPTGAHVSKLQVTEIDPAMEYTSFDIRR